MQRGANFDDDAGLAGEVSAGAPGKKGVACSPERKPVPFSAAGKTVEQRRLKPCKGKLFDVTEQLGLKKVKSESSYRGTTSAQVSQERE